MFAVYMKPTFGCVVILLINIRGLESRAEAVK